MRGKDEGEERREDRAGKGEKEKGGGKEREVERDKKEATLGVPCIQQWCFKVPASKKKCFRRLGVMNNRPVLESQRNLTTHMSVQLLSSNTAFSFPQYLNL